MSGAGYAIEIGVALLEEQSRLHVTELAALTTERDNLREQNARLLEALAGLQAQIDRLSGPRAVPESVAKTVIEAYLVLGGHSLDYGLCAEDDGEYWSFWPCEQAHGDGWSTSYLRNDLSIEFAGFPMLAEARGAP